jgi:hypothetical protein
MLEAAPPGIVSPPRAAKAAAVESDSCKTRERRNTDDDATINGFTSSHGGIDKDGTTYMGWPFSLVPLEANWPSAEESFPAKTAKKRRALIHSAVVVAIAAPCGPMWKFAMRTTSSAKLTRLAKTRIKIGLLVSRYPQRMPVAGC